MDMMEMKEEDSKDWFIKLEDFPFICRICCKRRDDLRPFEEESYLLDVFQTIRKIDVRSLINFPRNICTGCVNKLEEIMMFIEKANTNCAGLEMKSIPKKDISKTIDTTVEYYEGITRRGSQICQICSSPSDVTPIKEDAYFIQLIQNITNINITTYIFTCSSCVRNLVKISSFVTSILNTEEKLQNVILISEVDKTKSYQNSIEGPSANRNMRDDESFKGNIISKDKIIDKDDFADISEEIIDVKKESVPVEEEGSIDAKVTNGKIIGKDDFADESQEIFDIKEEIIDIKEAVIDIQDGSIDIKETNEKIIGKDDFADESQEMIDVKEEIVDTEEEGSIDIKVTNEKMIGKDIFAVESQEMSDIKEDIIDIKEKVIDIKKEIVFQKGHSYNHMLIHSKVFECHICKKQSISRSTFRNHLRSHGVGKLNQCDHCKIYFKRASSLERHMRSHVEGKRHNCDSCNIQFATKTTFNKHLLLHDEGKTHECDTCKQTFLSKTMLLKHLHLDHGMKPHECEVCQKCFRKKTGLQRHSLVHTGEKPFGCEVCQKRFNQKAILKRHLSTHSKSTNLNGS